jgi:hypothetical protein
MQVDTDEKAQTVNGNLNPVKGEIRVIFSVIHELFITAKNVRAAPSADNCLYCQLAKAVNGRVIVVNGGSTTGNGDSYFSDA